MSDELEIKVDESTELKARLDLMNIKYHHNAKVETLRNLLEEALKPTEVMTPQELRVSQMDAALSLVRCRITCMNPHKRDWTGEIFTTGNSIIGTVKKYVPYNCEHAESYHIPRIIVDSMRERKYLQVRGIKTASGATQETYFVPEFQVVELPPLTKEELETLASDQRNRRGE